jgi:hypothetical protein
VSFSTWQLAGVAAGFILAVVEYLVFGALAGRMFETRHAGPDALEREQSAKTLRVIRAVLACQLAFFPVLGYGIGSLVEA